MHDVQMSKQAERMGRAARACSSSWRVFFAGQKRLFRELAGDARQPCPGRRLADPVVLMLMLLATGGFLFRGERCATCSTMKLRATTASLRRRSASG